MKLSRVTLLAALAAVPPIVAVAAGAEKYPSMGSIGARTSGSTT